MTPPAPSAAEQEYYFLKNFVGLIRDSGLRRFRVEGRDAISYLHRRLSQSVKTLGSGEGAHALQLEGDGKMSADLLIYRDGDAIEVLCDADHAEAAYSMTEKFTLMDDVTLSHQWNQERILTLGGREAGFIISDIASLRPDARPFGAGRWVLEKEFDTGEPVCKFFGDGRWQTPMIHIAIAGEKMAEGVNCFIQAYLNSCGEMVNRRSLSTDDPFEFLRIEQGISKFGVDTSTSTIPLEAGLTDAIDFDKGCFPGQEVLAKIRNLGHPSRQLVRLEVDGAFLIPPSTEILVPHSGEMAPAGFVTSACAMHHLRRTLALGSVLWQFRDAAEVALQTSDGAQIPAKMVRLFEWQETGFRTRP